MKTDLTRIKELLKKLDENTPAQWGKMSAQHMIEHLILTYRICNGTREVSIVTGERLLPIQKRFLMSDKPLPKLFINPVIGEDLLPLEFESLESAKKELLNEIEKYELYFASNPEANAAHPVFGYLNKSEWDIFHDKHIRHHLLQFGIAY